MWQKLSNTAEMDNIQHNPNVSCVLSGEQSYSLRNSKPDMKVALSRELRQSRLLKKN